MDIWIPDINKLVAANNLKPVTSSLYFNSDGIPEPAGLFSYDIFGFPGSYERRNRFSYIQLDSWYLNPHVYKVLLNLDRNVAKIIDGSEYYVIDPKLKYFRVASEKDEADPTFGTGIEFLYENWEKIVWKETSSTGATNRKRSDRLNLLKKSPKSALFMDKQIVIPAFYRDMSFDDAAQGAGELNTFYRQLITSVEMLNQFGKMSFSYNMTKSKVQIIILNIHDHFTNGTKDAAGKKNAPGLLAKKTGFLHKSVLGKNIDYGVRTIITSATFTANSWKELPGTFEKAAIPLAQCIAAFLIAVQSWVLSFIETRIMDRTNLPIYNMATKQIEYKNLHRDWKKDFSEEMIIKRVAMFVHSPESRFYPVELRFEDGYHPFAFISDHSDLLLDDSTIDKSKLEKCRYFTWTDVFYLAAEDVTKDKHVILTRYPITGYHNEVFAGVSVRSTIKTCRMLIGGDVYERYPVVDLSKKPSMIEGLFVDATEVFPLYLGALGADHDGDQITIRSLYTYEANEFAKKYIQSLKALMDVKGGTSLDIGNVGEHSAYNLLRDPD